MNNEPNFLQLAKEGLWVENPGLVKLLGLCPLLAISNTAINGFSLGIATLITLVISNTLVSVCRFGIPAPIRIPLYVLIIASTVTVIELLMQAWLPQLFVTLGIFLPLIVTNCLILGRAEAFAVRHTVKLAIADALAMGAGFLLVLVALGALREFIGQGTVLADAHFLFGDTAKHWTVHVFAQQHGLLLALLPPGAFIGLGLLLAIKNSIDRKFHAAQSEKHAHQVTAGQQASRLNKSVET